MLLTYRIEQDQCEGVGEKFTWGGVNCNTVLRLLELGAEAWERHLLDVRIRSVTDAKADVDILVGALPASHEDALAVYIGGSSRSIVFSENECWHSHQDFCRFVNGWRWTIFNLLTAVGISSGVLGLLSLVAYCVMPRRMGLLLVAGRMAVALVVCALAFGMLRGCECAFFGLVAAHEFGHALGLGHTDKDDRDAVMHPSYYERRTSVCLDEVDLDVLNDTSSLGRVLRAPCVDEGPVLTPAGVICLVFAVAAIGYMTLERCIVSIPALRAWLNVRQ